MFSPAAAGAKPQPLWGGHVAAPFPDLLPVTRDEVLEACKMIARDPKLPVRDAVHAATMLRNGLRRIISVDLDFDRIPCASCA